MSWKIKQTILIKKIKVSYDLNFVVLTFFQHSIECQLLNILSNGEDFLQVTQRTEKSKKSIFPTENQDSWNQDQTKIQKFLAFSFHNGNDTEKMNVIWESWYYFKRRCLFKLLLLLR